MGPWLRPTREGSSWPYRHRLLFDVQRFQHGTGVRGAGLLDPPLGGAGRVDGGASTTVSGRNPGSIVVCGIFLIFGVCSLSIQNALPLCCWKVQPATCMGERWGWMDFDLGLLLREQ